MKTINLMLAVIIFVSAAAGWHIYQNHFVFQGESEQVVCKKLVENARFINDAAEKLEISSRLLASVIYAERRVNVNLLDSFESAYASLGNNTSIGLAQIRVNTAKWIMASAVDSSSSYVLESNYQACVPKYSSHNDVISLLKNDSVNCLLAAIHIKQILQRWRDAGVDINTRADIITTLYSYGLYRREDGSEIVPHSQPRSNFLGNFAKQFYFSGKMREVFQ